MVKLIEIITNFVVGFFSSLTASKIRDSAKGTSTNTRHTFLHRKTLQYVTNMRNGSEPFWATGKVCGEPVMQVAGSWFVTNMTKSSIQLLRTYIGKPKTEGTVCTRHPTRDIAGHYPILPGSLTEVHADFWIQPICCRDGESFKARVVFIDHLNKKHKVSAKFRSYCKYGELILSVKSRERHREELDGNNLPAKIRMKLMKNGINLTQNLEISISEKHKIYRIKDLRTPCFVYTAIFAENNLSIYKLFIPPPRQATQPVR